MRIPRSRSRSRIRAFIRVALFGVMAPALADAENFTNVAGPSFELSGLGVVRGGVLAADDELIGSVLFVSKRALEEGKPTVASRLAKIDRARTKSEPHTALTRLFPVQDFEGIATDGNKAVFLVGSHAPHKSGERRTDREFLIKTTWELEPNGAPNLRAAKAKRNGVPGVYREFVDHIEKLDESLNLDTLNVEGLALRDKSLYVGLRSPLNKQGHALIFSAKQKSMFGKDSQAFDGRFERLTLDLKGGGIRGMYWDEASGKLLVLSGPSSQRSRINDPRALWSYEFSSGKLKLEHRFATAQLKTHGTPEGIARFDAERLLIAFDTDQGARSSLLLLRWR